MKRLYSTQRPRTFWGLSSDKFFLFLLLLEKISHHDDLFFFFSPKKKTASYLFFFSQLFRVARGGEVGGAWRIHQLRGWVSSRLRSPTKLLLPFTSLFFFFPSSTPFTVPPLIIPSRPSPPLPSNYS